MSAPRPSLTIRRATPADVEVVRAISRATFVETFGHLYPPDDLAAFCAQAYGRETTARMLADPRQAQWLLERDGLAVGNVLAGTCGLPHPEVLPGDGEIKRLYILKEAHNGGWGARLMDTALAWLERDGTRTLWVGVWSENLGAQRFYARYGFEKAGEYEFPVGRTRDREFILRRPARV